ncbi:uncharacterized protein PRCAT00001903001 [Priceomyces carsonii]|uniref:uncharacterized protein n=1 Tax=Priceomyces carsonii TaxID=28549 RepID=UPI002ED7B1CA|nr:unnamed protein product [Priceomyces carsonii]
MNLLSLNDFLALIESFPKRDLLSPQEASKLLLIITELLVDHNVEPALLKFLSRFLTQQSYDDIVEERNIEHECGYILCNNAPQQRVRRLSANGNGTISASLNDPTASTKFQIYNRKPSMILPNTYLSQYCCKEHYQASLFYRNQLSSEAMFARKDILIASPFPPNYPSTWYENGITCLEEVLAKHAELKGQGKTLSDVITMMNGLSMADGHPSDETNDLIKLVEDFQIIERDGDTNDDDNELNDYDNYDKNKLSKSTDDYLTSNKSFGGYVV